MADEGAEHKGPKWNIGDRWKIGITLYSTSAWVLSSSDPQVEVDKNKPFILGRYIMEVQVVGLELVGGTICWELEFTPGPKAPKWIREQRLRIYVSPIDWSIRKIRRVAGEEMGDIYMPQVKEMRLVQGISGFPLEILGWCKKPRDSEGVTEWKESGLTVSRIEKSLKGAKSVKLIVKQDSKEMSRVKLTWPAEAKWWSEYTKHTEGHIKLHALTFGEQVSKQFETLYSQWREAKKQKKAIETKQKYLQMIGLGIAAVPYMMEKVKAGDVALIPAVSDITGEIKENATRSICLGWWRINKKRWLLPFGKGK